MKHPSSQELFTYWNVQRGPRAAPERADIEPGAIRGVLGDTFILATNAQAGHPFRLAGTRLCALFCRELKGEAFGGLWDRDGRSEMQARVGIVAEEGIGLIASTTGHSADGAQLDIELLLLPLAFGGNPRARIIGTLVPYEAPYWLGVSPITSMTLGSFRYLDAEIERDAPAFVSGVMPAPVPAAAATTPVRRLPIHAVPLLASAPRLQPDLRVYEGGRPE